MSSKSKNGYVARYDPYGDIMDLGISRARQPDSNIVDDSGKFEWRVSEQDDGTTECVGTEIFDWKSFGVDEQPDSDSLIRYICSKTGWDFCTLRELARKVVKENAGIKPDWEKERHVV